VIEHELEPVPEDEDVDVLEEQELERRKNEIRREMDDGNGRVLMADSELRRHRNHGLRRHSEPVNVEQEIALKNKRVRPLAVDEDEGAERESRSEEFNAETPTRGSSLRTIRRNPRRQSRSGSGRWTR